MPAADFIAVCSFATSAKIGGVILDSAAKIQSLLIDKGLSQDVLAGT
jgi:hypothetical protein